MSATLARALDFTHFPIGPFKKRGVTGGGQLATYLYLEPFHILSQPTSTTARNSHKFCLRVVPPEDGQVMPEACRDIEHQ
jgi:hypothetical protein